MRGPRVVSQSSDVAAAEGRAAQSRVQGMLANWGVDAAKEAAENVERARKAKLRKIIEDNQIKEYLEEFKAKEEQRKKEQAPQKEAQRRESQRLAIQKGERARHERLSKENPAFQAQLEKERAQAEAQAKARREAEAEAQAQEKARREAEAKARREAAKAQELGKRKREEEQDNFFSNSLKSFTEWASPLTANLGGPFSLPNPFAKKASAPTSSVANSPPPISNASIIPGYKQERPTKKQKTDIEPIQMSKSTPTPSDYGQYYLDGLYKRFNNGDNNFNIKTIIKEKDMSVMRGYEQNRVSYLNQRVAKWESELNKFGITQTAPKKIQTDGVDSEGNKIKRDDFLMQYGDYLKENIKTLKNEAANNSGSKDRNNKLNHLIAFHYLELAKMVYAGSEGLHNNLTNIPTIYKGFLEYSVGNSEFISTDLIQKPITVKTTDLGPRALRDIIYLEADIYKKLTGKATNICTLGISVPFDQVAYENQVTKITQRISSDDKTSEKKSPQQELDDLKERSQAAANKESLAQRYLPRTLSEIVSSNSYDKQKQAPFSDAFKRAAPASRSFTQEDAQRAHLQPPSGLGYIHPSTYVQNRDREARGDLNTLKQLYDNSKGMAMFTAGAQVPGREGGRGRGR